MNDWDTHDVINFNGKWRVIRFFKDSSYRILNVRYNKEERAVRMAKYFNYKSKQSFAVL